jgi:glycosyltransferase involved in cell wall biosynthesis
LHGALLDESRVSRLKRFLTPFRAVAILAVRNERHYIGRCLEHLQRQKMKVCIIDNDSTDGTSEIIQRFSRRLIIRYIRYPYPGYYDWAGMLKLKQRVATNLGAHWYLHCDADEILEPPDQFSTLKDAFREIGRSGYNAVNFDEFVFLPSSNRERWEGRDYVSGMRHYYHFAPKELRLVRAWKNTGVEVDLASSGGHTPAFPDQKVFPQSFVLRHYIGLSLDYIKQKYADRKYAADEIAKGWHHNRVGLDLDEMRLPPLSELKLYHSVHTWDKSDPWKKHFFERRPDRET